MELPPWIQKVNSTPYTTVCVSGGFDPVHIGHLRMMREAAEYGNLIVIVNLSAAAITGPDWIPIVPYG